MNDSLFLWAFNVLIQVTCVSALGLAIAAVLRKHATAKCWVLGSALLLMLLSPLIAAVVQGLGRSLISVEMHTSMVSNREAHSELLAPIPSDSELFHAAGGDKRAPRATAEAMGDVAAVGAADVTAVNDIERSSTPGVAASPLVAPQRGADAAAPNALAGIEPQRDVTRGLGLSHAWRRGAEILAAVWLAGTAFLLSRLGVSCWRLRRIISRAAPNTDPTIAKRFAKVFCDLQPKRTPKLGLSSEVSGPISAGWFRPQIILPTRLVEQVSAAHLHDILVHEVAHALRRDPLTVLLQNVAGAIYWFHPLALWLNRMLARAREEVCDNYVLATTSAPSYSRTLLMLAELATSRPLPGAAGLFTSRWKLEQRVAGLLDDDRNRGVELGRRARLLIAAMSLLVATGAALGTVTRAGSQDLDAAPRSEPAATDKTTDDFTPNANQTALLDGPMLRGQSENREMLLRGRVLDTDDKPAREFELIATQYDTHLGCDRLPARVEGHEFEVWIPVGGSHGFRSQLVATADNGSRRAVQGLAQYDLRMAALEGVDLRLTPTRSVEITVAHDGAPVANAHVSAQLSKSLLPVTETDEYGKAIFRLLENEKLEQLTAWTDDFRIGGYSFIRKPRRDPASDAFTIELHNCRDQTIRLLDPGDDSPVPNVPFELVIGTGAPDFNFVAVPATFPHSRMTTDEKGEATFRWFPDWETHGAYVEIIDPRWAPTVAHGNWTAGDDGALVMTLKRRVFRKPFVGKIRSDRLDVSGLLVEVRTFQGEEVSRSDHVYAFTDDAGNFTADIIPGATYTVCVNDARLLSPIIDVIPSETGNSNIPVLEVREGSPVKIRVTSGSRREPLRSQCVYVRQSHRYNWLSGGRKRSAAGVRDHHVYTDSDGVALSRELAGAEVQVNVYAGEWRSEPQRVTVKEDGVTLVEVHREVDTQREVKGRLLAPPNFDVKVADAEIVFGAIDGEIDEREVITADAAGRFEFKTQAIQLGIFAYTTDGKAAGVAKPESLDRPIEIRLTPTMDLNGQLLDEHDKPFASHAVRIVAQVSGRRDFNKSFATSFETRTFEAMTDANGNYTLKNLPTELAMRLRADSIDCPGFDTILDEFSLAVGNQRSPMISRLRRSTTSDDRPPNENHDGRPPRTDISRATEENDK